MFARVELTASNKIQVRRSPSDNALTMYSVEIIEFDGNVKVQKGVTSVSGTSPVVSISTVNLAKSFHVFSFSFDYNQSFLQTILMSELQSNRILFNRGNGIGTPTIAWFVVEILD